MLKTGSLSASLKGDLSNLHLFVLKHIHAHIDRLVRELAEIGTYMQPYARPHGLLQAIPCIAEIAAALIVVKIGSDLARFDSASRLACWAAF